MRPLLGDSALPAILLVNFPPETIPNCIFYKGENKLYKGQREITKRKGMGRRVQLKKAVLLTYLGFSK